MYPGKHNEVECLFHIPGARVYDVIGSEEPAPGAAPPLQTVSIVRVPLSPNRAGASFDYGSKTGSAHSQSYDEKHNYHLNISVSGGCSLDLPSSTRIRRDRPRRYRIPRWDMGHESNIFLLIDFVLPGSLHDGHGASDSKTNPSQKFASAVDIETFESIVDQSVVLEVAGAYDSDHEPLPAYNPGDSKWRGGEKGAHGRILLVDDEHGDHVFGELAEDATIVEDPSLAHDTGKPVEIQVSADGKRVEVRPITEDYLNMARHPVYKNSSLVQNAAAASRLIVTTSATLGRMMSQGAENFTQKTKPNEKPMTFKPSTHDGVKKIHNFTSGAAVISAKTLGSVSKYAQNLGAHMSGRTKKDKLHDETGKPVEEYKPGMINKGMIAFSTIADGIAQSGKHLLTSSGSAASTVVGHKYGAEAGSITADLAGGVKNVGLVYIDVTGVSHRAILKSVAKGAVVGKIKGDGNVVVAAVDADTPNPTPGLGSDLKAAEAQQGSYSGRVSPAPGYHSVPHDGRVSPIPGYHPGHSDGRVSPLPGYHPGTSQSGNQPGGFGAGGSTSGGSYYGDHKGEKYG